MVSPDYKFCEVSCYHTSQSRRCQQTSEVVLERIAVFIVLVGEKPFGVTK